MSRNCCGSRRPPRAARSIALADVAGPAMPTPGRSSSSDRASSVSSRPRVTSTGSDRGTRASARRRLGANEVRSASRARTSGNSRISIERGSTLLGCTPAGANARDRRARGVDEAPRAAQPGLGRVADPDAWRGVDPVRRPPRLDPKPGRRVEEVGPVSLRSMSKAAVTSPGPAASRAAGSVQAARRDPASPAARRPALRRGRAARRSPVASRALTHRRRPRRLDGADQHRRRRAPSGSVTTFRQSCIP